MNDSSIATRSSLLVVILCFMTIAVDGYDLIVYGATVSALLAEPGWGLTAAGAGMIGSWTLAGLMLGLFGAGSLSDRIGRRKLIMAGVFWFSVGSLLCALAHSPTQLGIARFLTGIGLGSVVPSSVALTVEYAPRNRRQLYNALALTGYAVGGVICALLAIALLQSHGWRVLYGAGALYVVVLPLMVFFLPESVNFLVDRNRMDEARALAARYSIDFDRVLAEHKNQAWSHAGAGELRGFRLLMSTEWRSAVLLFAIVCFCGQIVVYGMNVWLPTLMRKAGYPLGSSLHFLLVMQFGAVAGNLFGAWLADRVGSRKILVAFFVVCALSLLALSQKPEYGWLMLAVFGAGLGSIGSTTLGYGYIAAYFPASCRGSAIGTAQGLGRIGSVLGPMIGGWVVGSNLGQSWHFYVFAIPSAIAALMVTRIPRRAQLNASYAEA
ncbi:MULTISPECIES: MFS transporter [Burkholderia cepacia complex]|uniref:MFS transporter n=1 Tax=Burkholderia cepacia complex TaxID=87882 RepID=UPI00075A6398|nr:MULTISPECIES: aromatic acid/H+ symport family MFS transporter [Burkholderia cepacia complex]AOI90516.1 MFS transporter [Burkholderia pseudomultivorans]KVK90959.1 MFS transporter [Burkholderia cepacia]